MAGAGRDDADVLRRLLPAAMTLVVVVLACTPVSSGQELVAEQPWFGYRAGASADGVRAVIEAKGYLFVDRLVDVGAPTARASVDASGVSTGYAALPDPGDLVIAAPSLAAGLGLPAPVPDYPLFVRSEARGQPEAELATQSYTLRATSDETSTTSSAEIGAVTGEPAVGRTSSLATAALDTATGDVTAQASATTDGFVVLGGLLRFGRVESSAGAAQEAGGEIERSSEFKVEGATILGQTVKVNDRGITVGDGETPVPLTGGNDLLAALAAAGVEVRYLAPIELPDGIVSAGLEIATRVPLPNAPEPALVRYTLGRATATVSPATTVQPGGDLVAAVPTDGEGPGSLVVGRPDILPTAPSDAGPESIAPPVPAAPTVGVEVGRTTLLAATTRSLGAFYLVIVAGALVALGGAQLIRILGVRSSWMS